jgi:2-polyprenyl-3-methyl-5-hydroxy-6-metoxy-1,4-benzoquinol methylase
MVDAPTGACPVCASVERVLYATAQDVEYRSSDDEFDYFECLSCRSIYLDDPPVTRLREIYPATYYSNNAGVTQSFLFRLKAQMETWAFRRILKDVPGESLSALDVGGGTGWILSTIRDADARVRTTTVLEIDEACRGQAERDGHAFVANSIEGFDTTARFDFILLLNLIEHVVDPAAVLRKAASLLTAHGVLLLKTPNVDSWDRFLFRKAYWGGLHCPRHWVLFNRASLVDVAKRSGLDVLRVSYTQGSPQWTGSVLGTMSRYGLIDVSVDRPLYTHPLCNVFLGLFAALDFARQPFFKTAQMFVLAKRS